MKKKITINSYLYKNKWLLAGLLLFSMLAGMGEALWSFVFQEIYEIAENMDYSALLRLGGLVVFSFLFFEISNNIVNYFRRILLRKVNLQLKTDVFNSIINKDINEFTESNSAKYISILNNEVSNLENQYFVLIPAIINNVFIFTACAAALIYYDITIAVVVVVTALIPVLIPFFSGKKISQKEQIVFNELENYNGRLKDLLGGFEVIKSFNAVDRIKKIFETNVNKVEEARCDSRKYQNPYAVLLIGLTYLVLVVQLLYTAYMIFIGKIPGSAMVAISFLISSINNPIREMAQNIVSLKAVRPNVEKVEELLNKKEEEKIGLIGNIEEIMPLEVKNLSFGYEKEKEILHGINFTFEKNKKYAIVGNSGSGKSTFVKLLMKYYENYSGEICWGNNELGVIDKEKLCGEVAMIHQKVFMFEETLRNNITMFQDYPEEEVQYAVEASGLKEIVEKHPEGLDFMVNESGNNFSGGEQQRISIARAILKKAKVLILDEATSSLDKKLSAQIERLILNQPEMTIITVTHKLDDAILRQYDCILAMNQGNILEVGDFDALMEKKGFFYSLYTVNE